MLLWCHICTYLSSKKVPLYMKYSMQICCLFLSKWCQHLNAKLFSWLGPQQGSIQGHITLKVQYCILVCMYIYTKPKNNISRQIIFLNIFVWKPKPRKAIVCILDVAWWHVDRLYYITFCCHVDRLYYFDF